MDEHNEEYARKIIEHFTNELKYAPCSEKHHLNINGGLMIHLENVLKCAIRYFPDEKNLQFLALIHDIGKARVYRLSGANYITYKEPSIDHIIHTLLMLFEFGVKLSDDEVNALQFHHGGWSSFKGNMTELAIKLHFCDMIATMISDKHG